SVEVGSFRSATAKIDGKDKDQYFVTYAGNDYEIEPRSTWDGGLLGGGITSFYDLSITKNVLGMIVVCLLLLWLFRKAVKSYQTSPDRAPKGVQGFLEPMFLFIRDEVAIPFIGKDK